MYSDRRGNGQKPPRIKPSRQNTLWQKPRKKTYPKNNWERLCPAGSCPGFFVLGLLKMGGSEMCDVLLGVSGCVTKCDRGRGWSKLAKWRDVLYGRPLCLLPKFQCAKKAPALKFHRLDDWSLLELGLEIIEMQNMASLCYAVGTQLFSRILILQPILELYRYPFLPIIPIPSGTDDWNSRYRLCGRLWHLLWEADKNSRCWIFV